MYVGTYPSLFISVNLRSLSHETFSPIYWMGKKIHTHTHRPLYHARDLFTFINNFSHIYIYPHLLLSYMYLLSNTRYESWKSISFEWHAWRCRHITKIEYLLYQDESNDQFSITFFLDANCFSKSILEREINSFTFNFIDKIKWTVAK